MAQNAKNQAVVEIEADAFNEVGETILQTVKGIPIPGNASDGRSRRKLLTILKNHFRSKYDTYVKFVNQPASNKPCC